MSTPQSIEIDPSFPREAPLTLELLRAYLKKKVLCVRGSDESIGLELEAFLLRSAETGDKEGQQGELRGILEENRLYTAGLLLQYALDNDWYVFSEKMPEGEQLISGFKLPCGGSITFEPGKQLEYSSAPHKTVHALMEDVRRIQDLMAREISREQKDLHIYSLGSYPLPAQDFDEENFMDALVVPKARYRALMEYLVKIDNQWGISLMNHTCATQVCMDAGKSAEDIASRYVTGFLLAPLSYGIFSFSPFVKGNASEFLNSRVKLVESFDDSRMGLDTRLLKRMTSEDEAHSLQHCLAYYEELLWNSRMIYIPGDHAVEQMPDCTFGQWFQKGIDGVYPTVADLELQLSLVFPEVRAKKGFYELRSADAQAPVWQFMPLLYYLALMLDEDIRRQVRDVLLKDEAYYRLLWRESRYGLAKKDISEVANKVMQLALEGVSKLSSSGILQGSELESKEIKKLQIFAEHFTFAGRTPSDDLMDKVQSYNKGFHQKVWQELLEDWDKLVL